MFSSLAILIVDAVIAIAGVILMVVYLNKEKPFEKLHEHQQPVDTTLVYYPDQIPSQYLYPE